MNEYSTQELKGLLEVLELAEIENWGAVDKPEAALLILLSLIRDYQKEDPEKIRSKINEFSEIGKLNEASSVIEPHHQVYLLMYEYPLEEMPKFLGTPFEILAAWRLCLPQKIVI